MRHASPGVSFTRPGGLLNSRDALRESHGLATECRIPPGRTTSIAEEFTNGSSGKGQVLMPRVRSRCRSNNHMSHRTGTSRGIVFNLLNSTRFLTYDCVDTVSGFSNEILFLIDNGINIYGSLPVWRSPMISSLARPIRSSMDLILRCRGLVHRLTVNNARCFFFPAAPSTLQGWDFPIDRIAQRITTPRFFTCGQAIWFKFSLPTARFARYHHVSQHRSTYVCLSSRLKAP